MSRRRREEHAEPSAPSAAEPEAPSELEARKAWLATHGKVLCRAKRTCLAGMPYYEGDEFTLDTEQAAAMEARGDLEIL